MIDWTKLFCFGCLGSVAIMALICYVQTLLKKPRRNRLRSSQENQFERDWRVRRL